MHASHICFGITSRASTGTPGLQFCHGTTASRRGSCRTQTRRIHRMQAAFSVDTAAACLAARQTQDTRQILLSCRMELSGSNRSSAANRSIQAGAQAQHTDTRAPSRRIAGVTRCYEACQAAACSFVCLPAWAPAGKPIHAPVDANTLPIGELLITAAASEGRERALSCVVAYPV